ncbi:MAG: hypothetical protein NTY29_05460, partial [Proteobacteria bacterium]|nr:hypothetical protein [Pseudomonadota bacterium]
GTVYVADAWQSLILKYDANGNFITAWGDPLNGSGGRFSFRPTYLAIDSSGNVFSTDYYNNRVQKFDATGTLITTWGIQGSLTGEFSYPTGIAVDSSDNVFVVDTFNNRVQKFDNSGTFITEWGSAGDEYGFFNWPIGAAVNSSGKIYIADTLNNRIQIFNSSDKACIFTSLLGETDPNINKIRNFRDTVLVKSVLGRQLIGLYYKTSGMFQPLLEKNPSAKKTTEIMLKSFLPVIDMIIQ